MQMNSVLFSFNQDDFQINKQVSKQQDLKSRINEQQLRMLERFNVQKQFDIQHHLQLNQHLGDRIQQLQDRQKQLTHHNNQRLKSRNNSQTTNNTQPIKNNTEYSIKLESDDNSNNLNINNNINTNNNININNNTSNVQQLPLNNQNKDVRSSRYNSNQQFSSIQQYSTNIEEHSDNVQSFSEKSVELQQLNKKESCFDLIQDINCDMVDQQFDWEDEMEFKMLDSKENINENIINSMMNSNINSMMNSNIQIKEKQNTIKLGQIEFIDPMKNTVSPVHNMPVRQTLNRDFSHLNQLQIVRNQRKKQNLQIDPQSIQSSSDIMYMQRQSQKNNIICFR